MLFRDFTYYLRKLSDSFQFGTRIIVGNIMFRTECTNRFVSGAETVTFRSKRAKQLPNFVGASTLDTQGLRQTIELKQVGYSLVDHSGFIVQAHLHNRPSSW